MGFLFFIWVVYLLTWGIQTIRVMERAAADNIGYRFLSYGFFILTLMLIGAVYVHIKIGGTLIG